MGKNKHQRRQIGIKKARRVLRVLREINKSTYYEEGGMCEKRLIKTRVPCSCWMCGNPRRHFGKVKRKEKFIEDFDLEDFEDNVLEIPNPDN